MKISQQLLLILGIFISFQSCSNAQKANTPLTSVGFYNLENLFDTLVDPDPNKIMQSSFTPKGSKKWTSERYHSKLNKIASVIANLGVDAAPNGLAILGVAEVENKTVLTDLIKKKTIQNKNYQIVHSESPDKRGIDVALLYNPTIFSLTSSASFEIPDTSLITRSQLLVSGNLNGELTHIIVAHWPSRRGGMKKSAPKRMIAAQLTQYIIDSLQLHNPKTHIIFMGDLNDNPTNNSVKHISLNNPFAPLHTNLSGSLKYQNQWFLFDQILVTDSLKNSKAFIYHPLELIQTEGNYKTYPNRTYAGNKYLGGYSDHFPVYILIKTKHL